MGNCKEAIELLQSELSTVLSLKLNCSEHESHRYEFLIGRESGVRFAINTLEQIIAVDKENQLIWEELKDAYGKKQAYNKI